MKSLIDQVAAYKVEVTKCLSEERDVQREGHPMKRRHDMIFFVLPNKYSQLLDEMKKAFEDNGRGNPNCYGINSMSEASNGDGMGQPRRMMIGDNMADYVEIGKSYINYLNINILDTSDTTKTHRYGYALEWRATNDDKGMIGVRYTVTYAKIPSTSAIEVIKYKSSDNDPFKYFNFEDNRDAQKRYQEFIKKRADAEKELQHLGDVRIPSKLLVNGDSAFVIKEIEGTPFNSVDEALPAMERGKYLLLFSTLKKKYKTQKNSEFTAISIYSLCKQAVEEGYFTDDSMEELKQWITEVAELTEEAKTETDRKYFRMAREQLDKILESRK